MTLTMPRGRHRDQTAFPRAGLDAFAGLRWVTQIPEMVWEKPLRRPFTQLHWLQNTLALVRVALTR
jgi:hypothetical protein